MNEPVSFSESKRLTVLRCYDILDTLPEESFDGLALLAAQICQTPVALISLVDENRQWLKAKVGIPISAAPREGSFCTHAIQQRGVFVVRDAEADGRFAMHALVTGEPHARFYAGAPLVTPEGEAIGTICVIDRVPRDLSQSQLEALQSLSRQTISQLELRRLLLVQKRVEQTLRASRERLEVAVRGATAGFVMKSLPDAGPRDDTPSAPKPLRVLVADPHDIVRCGLKQLLIANFRDIILGEAKNAQETIEHCRRHHWDVVLLELALPDRSGLDILGDLKRVAPEVPILIMSAFPEKEFALRALKCGAWGWLNKATIAAELVTAVNRVMTGDHYIGPTLGSKLVAQGGDGTRPAHEALSRREFQVLCLIAGGKRMKEIAADLSLSEKTVGTYRTRISRKLGLGNVVEITRYAMRQGLIE